MASKLSEVVMRAAPLPVLRAPSPLPRGRGRGEGVLHGNETNRNISHSNSVERILSYVESRARSLAQLPAGELQEHVVQARPFQRDVLHAHGQFQQIAQTFRGMPAVLSRYDELA